MKQIETKKIMVTINLTEEKIKKARESCAVFYDQARKNDELHILNCDIVNQLDDYISFEEKTILEKVEESTDEIRTNNNPSFIENLLDFVKDKNYLYHATSSGDEILKSGLQCNCSEKEINYTTVYYNNATDNELLFEFYNGMHHNQQQIIVVNAKDNDLIKNGDKFILPTEFIKGYIDLKNQQVIKNPAFINPNHVDDRIVTKENVPIFSSEKELNNSQQNTISNFLKTIQNLHTTKSDDLNNEIHSQLYRLLTSNEPFLEGTNDEWIEYLNFINRVSNEIQQQKEQDDKSQDLKATNFKKTNNKKTKLSMDNTDAWF